MSLRVKLVSAIAAFMMVLGIFIVAVLAANNASVNLGGSLSFDAKDVVARVTGSATGAQVNPQNLDVTYSSRDTVGDETVWEDLSLNFIDHKTAIVFSFTVENLSTERSLTLTFTDNLAANAYIEKEVLRDGAAYTSGAQVQLDAKAEGITTNKTSFTVEFRVADGDTSFSGVTFDYLLNLYDESAVPEPPTDFTGFTFETSATSNEATLTSYTGTEANLVIPSTFSIVDGEYVDGNDYTVTAIADGNIDTMQGVFTQAAQTLQSVVLPDTLKTIGEFAFFYCISLSEVIIPEGVTSIGQAAFMATGLTEVTIPASVTELAVSDSDNVNTVPSFSACPFLTEITVAEGNPVYHSSGSNAIIETATKTLIQGSNSTIIPNDGSVTSIDAGAFTSCVGLASITIPASVTSIGASAFGNCYSLETVTFEGDSQIKTIGESIFLGCDSLHGVADEYGVEYLGGEQNQYLILLNASTLTKTTYTIPIKCKIIYEKAFNGNSISTSITIPSSVIYISNNLSLSSCTNLESITVDPANPVYHSAGNAVIETATKTLIQGCKSTIIPTDGSVTSIGDSAFFDCDGLTTISIPDSVTSIGEYAFSNCDELSSVTINGSIGIGAFMNCEGLRSVTINDGVTSIGESAFSTCLTLTTVSIPNSVTSIGERAFMYCTSLRTVTLPDSVISIGNEAFSNCYGLTTVSIPSRVTSIGGSAFYYCIRLTTITIPDSVTSIGSHAFDCCDKLTTFTINATTPPILGSRVFDTAVTSIYVPAASVETYKAADGWSTFAAKIKAIA